MLLKEKKLSLYQVDSDGFFCTAEATYPLTLPANRFNIAFDGKACRIRAALKIVYSSQENLSIACRIRAALKCYSEITKTHVYACRIRAALKHII